MLKPFHKKKFGTTLVLISSFVIFSHMIYILVKGLPRLKYMAFMITTSRTRTLHHLIELKFTREREITLPISVNSFVNPYKLTHHGYGTSANVSREK